MPNKTITKISFVVIFWTVLSLSFGCGHNPVSNGQPPSFDGSVSDYGEPQEAGSIESGEITESSGITSSKCQPNVLWTHNDSGDGPFVFAIDQTGRNLGTWKVGKAENTDWEDIASIKDRAGKCFLYIGDIGNTRKEPRPEHKIYRIAEPDVSKAQHTSRKESAVTADADVLTFSYPDERQDAETLMVEPGSGTIYVVTKQRNKAAGVYKIAAAFDSKLTAERIGEITVPAIPNGFLTGGDISPDGKRMVLCDYFAAYEFLLPSDAKTFDDVFRQKPVSIALGERTQGESVGYSADGLSLFATSEGRYQPLVRVDRKK